MFDLLKFKEASIDLKLQEIKDHGDFVLETDIENIRIRLFLYNKFYVELIYSSGLGTLKDVKSINHLEAAEKYIKLEGRLDSF